MHVQSYTLLLADVFENFRNKCIAFCVYNRISMANLLKNDWSKIRILTDIDMLLMVEKDIRGRICHAIHRYAKANNKYMKNYDKSIEASYLMYLYANNLYGWAMSQKWPVNGFE